MTPQQRLAAAFREQFQQDADELKRVVEHRQRMRQAEVEHATPELKQSPSRDDQAAMIKQLEKLQQSETDARMETALAALDAQQVNL